MDYDTRSDGEVVQARRVEVPCDGRQLARENQTRLRGGGSELGRMLEGETHRSACKSLGAHALDPGRLTGPLRQRTRHSGRDQPEKHPGHELEDGSAISTARMETMGSERQRPNRKVVN